MYSSAKNKCVFICEECGAELVGWFWEEDMNDLVMCECGKQWVVQRPTLFK
jgi:hypothetical protein